jgi:hypothetical protein
MMPPYLSKLNMYQKSSNLDREMQSILIHYYVQIPVHINVYWNSKVNTYVGI